MKTEPRKEHQWLQKLVGEWAGEGEATMAPDKPPEKFQTMETVRSMGGIWILLEGRGDTPDGGTDTTLMTLGFDPLKRRFTGTFIAAMMTHMWHYDGELDAAEKVLTLHTDGPSVSEASRMTKYKDVIEMRGEDHRVLTSHMLGDDGRWVTFMTAHYRRKP